MGVVVRSEQQSALRRAAEDEYVGRLAEFVGSASTGEPATHREDDVVRIRGEIQTARSLGLDTERQIAAFVAGQERAFAPHPELLDHGWAHKTTTQEVLRSFPGLDDSGALAKRIDQRFTRQVAGRPCAKCRLIKHRIELQISPLPPNHMPDKQITTGEEKSFEEDYTYTFVLSDTSIRSATLSFATKTTIIVADVPPGICTFRIKSPKFAEGDQVEWRKDWSSLATITDATFSALATNKVHRFLMINELWVAATFTAGMMTKCVSDPRLSNVKFLLGEAKKLEHLMSDALCSKARLEGDADHAFAELFDYGKVWDLKGPFVSMTVKSLEEYDLKVGDLGVALIPDHKLGHWHSWGPWEYYYDVWANFFFGFAGRQAGYDLDRLLGAASRAQLFQGAKQTLANIADFKLKLGTFRETKQDSEAIQFGFHLSASGRSFTAHDLVKEVTSNPAYERRPHSYNSITGARTIRRVSTTASPKKVRKKAQKASSANVRERVLKYRKEILAAAHKHGVPPELIAATIQKESAGDPNALSFDQGHGKGLMQIDDRSHAFAKTPEVFDPEKSIDYGAAYIRENMDAFPGNRDAAIAAYNAGAPGVRKGLKRGRPLSSITYDPDYVSDVNRYAAEYSNVEW